MPEPTLLDGSSGGGYTVVNTIPGPIGALQRKQHEFGIVFTFTNRMEENLFRSCVHMSHGQNKRRPI